MTPTLAPILLFAATAWSPPQRCHREQPWRRPPAHVQQRIRAAAEAKRERRRLARIRHHELTALGREAWRLRLEAKTVARSDSAFDPPRAWSLLAKAFCAFEALRARRRQP